MRDRDDEEKHSSAFRGYDSGESRKKDGSWLKIGITPSAPVNVRLEFNFVTVHKWSSQIKAGKNSPIT
jgi:hypothetical protein